MNKTVKVGIVGAGFAAAFHLRSYRQVQGVPVEIVAIADVNQARAEDLAKRFGIPKCYDDFRHILDDRSIQVVDLVVPNALHLPMVLQAAQADKHIICEKPLTGYFGQGEPDDKVGSTPKREMLRKVREDLKKVAEVMAAHPVKFCYAENWVYAPPVAKARKLLVASNAKILEMRGGEAHSGSHSPYSYQWKFTGGGSLIRQGAHPVGAAIQLKHWEGLRLKDKPIHPESVVCEVGHLREVASKSPGGQKRNYFLGIPQDVEDWAACLINFGDGTKAILNAGDCVLGGIQNVMSIYADTCRIHCNINPNDSVQAYTPDKVLFEREYIVEKTETKEGWSFPQPDEEFMTGYYDEMEDFVQCIINENQQPLSGLEVSSDCIKTIYAGYLSAEKGQRISIE